MPRGALLIATALATTVVIPYATGVVLAPVLRGLAARGTTPRRVDQPLAGIELLLTRSEREGLPTILTGELTILVHDLLLA